MSGGHDSRILVWDAESNAALHTFTGHRNTVSVSVWEGGREVGEGGREGGGGEGRRRRGEKEQDTEWMKIFPCKKQYTIGRVLNA